MRVAPAPLWLRRAAQTVLVTALLQTTPGCTFVGAGIGSQYPRYETVPAERLSAFPRGKTVEVDAKRVTWQRAGVTRTVVAQGPLRGKIVNNFSGTLVLGTDSGWNGTVERQDAVEVRVQKGSYAGAGAAVGILVDLAILTAVAASAAGSFSMQPSSSGNPQASGVRAGHFALHALRTR